MSTISDNPAGLQSALGIGNRHSASFRSSPATSRSITRSSPCRGLCSAPSWRARGMPAPGKLLLILLCMVTARTVAMSANRLLDAKLDALNPRTARRAIPSGALSTRFVLGMVALCAVAFILATALFEIVYHNPLPLIWSVPVLLFISGYPFLKRFSRLCHYYLGAALALAPVCAWVAIRGDVELAVLLMAAAVLLWTRRLRHYLRLSGLSSGCGVRPALSPVASWDQAGHYGLPEPRTWRALPR